MADQKGEWREGALQRRTRSVDHRPGALRLAQKGVPNIRFVQEVVSGFRLGGGPLDRAAGSRGYRRGALCCGSHRAQEAGMTSSIRTLFTGRTILVTPRTDEPRQQYAP